MTDATDRSRNRVCQNGHDAGEPVQHTTTGGLGGQLRRKAAARRDIAFGMLFFAGWALACASQPRPEHDAVTAFLICQDFVDDRLRSPATADFPSGASQFTTDLGGGQYRVRAYVDSQNGFGATLRTDFDCTVQWAGGTQWTLSSLNLTPR